MGIDVRDLVDAEQGLVNRRIFIDRAIYEQELEKNLRPLLAFPMP